MNESEEIQQKNLEDANATEVSRSPTPSVHEAALVPSKRNKEISTSALKKKKVQEGQNNEDDDIEEASEHAFKGILTSLPKREGGEFGNFYSLPTLNDPRIGYHTQLGYF